MGAIGWMMKFWAVAAGGISNIPSCCGKWNKLWLDASWLESRLKCYCEWVCPYLDSIYLTECHTS